MKIYVGENPARCGRDVAEASTQHSEHAMKSAGKSGNIWLIFSQTEHFDLLQNIDKVFKIFSIY